MKNFNYKQHTELQKEESWNFQSCPITFILLDGILQYITLRDAHGDPASSIKGWGEGIKFLA